MTSFLSSFITAFEKAGSKAINLLTQVTSSEATWRDLPKAFYLHFGGALITPVTGEKIDGVYYMNTETAQAFIAFPVQSLTTHDRNKKQVPDIAAINRHIFWTILYSDPSPSSLDYDMISLPFQDQIKLINTTFAAFRYLAQDAPPRTCLS